MLLKLPVIIASASVARFCFAAPTVEGNRLSARESSADVETTNYIPSAITNGYTPSNDDIVGIAQHATEICGCPPGKVGYFNHGQCACSGDPISPSYDIEMAKTTGLNLDSRITQHGPPPKQVQYNCPPCPRYFWSYKDYLGKCRCRPPLQKRELSFKKIESFQEKRQAPVHSYPDTPDALFIDKDDVKWQKDCVNEKKCPPGLRGRDISSMDPELHMKREAVSLGFSPRIGSSSTPSAEAQHKCFLSKPCPPGQGSWPVKDDCVCTELDKEQDASNRHEPEQKREALVTDEEKGEYVYRTITITTCYRSPECSKIGLGWHGVPFHNRCICVPPLDKKPRDIMVSAKLSDRSDIEDALSQHHTVEKRGASVTIMVRGTPFLEKRHDSSPCSHIQCPSGYIPTSDVNPKTFDLCFCKRDSGHSFSRLPGPLIDGYSLGKSPQWKDRKSNVQIPVIDDSITIPFPPQQNYNGPEPHHMCAEPQCLYAFIFHSDGVCECINSPKKRQDSGSCGDFSCPAGFAPKLNGQICYCGIDENSPLPQGPTSLGPHGGMPGGYEQGLSSASVNLDGEARQTQQRSTHFNKKRQDSDGCPNLGCPAGYIPSMDGGICYCGIDGGFPYPQAPASMGPQGMSAFNGNEEDMSSTSVPVDGGTNQAGAEK